MCSLELADQMKYCESYSGFFFLPIHNHLPIIGSVPLTPDNIVLGAVLGNKMVEVDTQEHLSGSLFYCLYQNTPSLQIR
jgi:hypothetical protein